MKFRHDSDETACGNKVPCPSCEGHACLRTAGHEPPCVDVARVAAEADGVCFECRMPLSGPHRSDCERNSK